VLDARCTAAIAVKQKEDEMYMYLRGLVDYRCLCLAFEVFENNYRGVEKRTYARHRCVMLQWNHSS